MISNSKELLKNSDDQYTIAEQQFIAENKDEAVTVFLTNGVKIGNTVIIAHDEVCLIVTQRDGKKQQLIYKSSIATIQSSK